MAETETEARMSQHLEFLPFAIEAAKQSPCQSKRGVVIWDEYGTVSVGFNHQPAPFICDGSNACKMSCGKTAVHAEQMALLQGNRSRIHGAEMLHIKVIDGKPVPSDGPSCLQCSKLILEAGIAGMWLLHHDGWKRYGPAEFHYRSSTASEYLRWPTGVRA